MNSKQINKKLEGVLKDLYQLEDETQYEVKEISEAVNVLQNAEIPNDL